MEARSRKLGVCVRVCVCVIRQSSDWLPLQCGAASFSELFVLWVASPVCLSVFMCVMREVWESEEKHVPFLSAIKP